MEEAARTLRALRVSGMKPKGLGNKWPDVVHKFEEAFGYGETEMRAPPPTPDAITRMDEALNWLFWLEPDQAQLVWLHAEGVPRKMLMAKLGVCRTKVWSLWAAAILTIVTTLNVGMGERKIVKRSKTEKKWAKSGQNSVIFPVEADTDLPSINRLIGG
ncbi:MAG: hypothetical protein HQL87_07825 [Magnetococcales bacterium]|nr:hypothetical protein [Magnetococcales bacterium]